MKEKLFREKRKKKGGKNVYAGGKTENHKKETEAGEHKRSNSLQYFKVL